MTQIYILIAIMLGVISRIVLMDGYMVLPELKDGQLKLNTLGTILIGFICVLVIYVSSPAQITTPLQAFVFAYITPYAVDKISRTLTSTDEETI
ncbi:MAG: hypothetical protein Q8M06_00425 [Methanobacteriaceae archaeon]|nr:hypothetical protein [Methanobacteriaceae archaeon]